MNIFELAGEKVKFETLYKEEEAKMLLLIKQELRDKVDLKCVDVSINLKNNYITLHFNGINDCLYYYFNPDCRYFEFNTGESFNWEQLKYITEILDNIIES